MFVIPWRKNVANVKVIFYRVKVLTSCINTMQLLIPKSLTLMVILCFMSVTCFGVVISAPSIGIVFAQQTPDFPLQSIEEDTPFTTAGDVAALTVRNVSSGSGSICEGCQVLVYNTGASPIGDVGVAYTPSSPLDLTGAKRLVFFARGELGGEVIRFGQSGINQFLIRRHLLRI